jgi:hypothetical protein
MRAEQRERIAPDQRLTSAATISWRIAGQFNIVQPVPDASRFRLRIHTIVPCGAMITSSDAACAPERSNAKTRTSAAG